MPKGLTRELKEWFLHSQLHTSDFNSKHFSWKVLVEMPEGAANHFLRPSVPSLCQAIPLCHSPGPSPLISLPGLSLPL